MGIKGILFSLFLYTALVWIAALYRNPSSTKDMREFGLFWTGAGIVAILAFLIGARLLTWIRLWNARRAARPKPVAKPGLAPESDEDGDLSALLQEAESALARIRGTVHQQSTKRFGGLPVHLLVGPEGSGKTSTFARSGVEPELLAGQIGVGSTVQPTRVANIWLARGAVFIELSGRAFNGDLGQWTKLLRTLCGGPKRRLRWWERFRRPVAGPELHSVFSFSETKGLVAGVHSDLLARESHHWQERLRTIGEVFNAQYVTHHVVTRCDSITYFEEFFSRMPETEANQLFGCRLPGGTSVEALKPDLADVQAKRLTSTFNELCQALSERRIVHLAYESDRSKRPAIYEFPREFKRLRPALVEFLTDVYRPNPKRFGPVLAGYYFTGTRDVPAAVGEVSQTRSSWTAMNAALDATRLFRSEATQFFNSGGTAVKAAVPGLVRRWMFSLGVFQTTVESSRPARPIAPPDAGYERQIGLAAAAVGVGCILLTGIWMWSWSNNRDLLGGLLTLPRVQARSADSLTLADLRSLEALRQQSAKLTDWQRNGAPPSMRFGLYSGNRVADVVRTGYFRRLQELSLNDLNGGLIAELRSLPTVPDSGGRWDPVYRGLATHIMMTSAACKPDSAMVAGVLKQIAGKQQPMQIDEARSLLARQLDYYASELPYGVPVTFSQDGSARDHGRRYLANVQSIERVYASILAAVEKDAGRRRRLSDIAPNYTSVLTGVSDVRSVFSTSGWQTVLQKSAEGGASAAGDPCVVGGGAGDKLARQDSETQRAIQGRYLNDYGQAWRNYLSAISVVRYRSADDAGAKLGMLSAHTSPLLAALALASEETDFPASTKQDDGLLATLGKKVPALASATNTAEKAAGKAAELTARQSAPPSDPADVSRTFQPVQAVVPPHSSKWVQDKNTAYVDALAGLATSMREVARAGPMDPAVNQAAAQSYDKALDAAHQLARAFNSVGVNGVDQQVVRLLEEPIVHARPFITRDITVAEKGKANGELAKFCAESRGLFARFPLSSASAQDSNLQEIAAVFAPGAGSLWKMQAQSLADFVAKEGSQWKPKDPAKKPQATPEVLELLNRAQAFTDAFYPAGSTQPQLAFTLRPRLDGPWKDGTLELETDGSIHAWTTSLQKRFTWPSTKSPATGAEIKVRVGNLPYPVAKSLGPWGIFRIMAAADPRPLGVKQAEWSRVRVPGGAESQLPAPVRIEIVEFPGNADLFNPKFFDSFKCPGRAVQ